MTSLTGSIRDRCHDQHASSISTSLGREVPVAVCEEAGRTLMERVFAMTDSTRNI